MSNKDHENVRRTIKSVWPPPPKVSYDQEPLRFYHPYILDKRDFGWGVLAGFAIILGIAFFGTSSNFPVWARHVMRPSTEAFRMYWIAILIALFIETGVFIFSQKHRSDLSKGVVCGTVLGLLAQIIFIAVWRSAPVPSF